MDWTSLLSGLSNLTGSIGTTAADIINAQTYGSAVQANPNLAMYYAAQYPGSVAGAANPGYVGTGIGLGTLLIIGLGAFLLLRK